MRLSPLLATLLATALLPAHAAIGIGSPATVYAQDFDALTQTTSPATAWQNDVTLAGWSLFVSNGNAAATYAADAGGSNAGTFRSHGAAGAIDRALGGVGSGGSYFGSPASGAVAGWIAVALANTSLVAFDSFTVAFDGEQWRNGGNTSAQAMVFEYGFGASFGAVQGWIAPGANFDWSSPVTGSSAAAVDGNGAGLVAGRGGSVQTAWAPGDTLWLRWTERNDVGNDHGLAIDNLQFSVTAVPEPAAVLMMLAGLGVVGAAVRRRG